MLLVPRTNAVNHTLALHHIVLAKEFVCLLAAGIGAQHFTGKPLRIFLRHATLHGIHLQEFSRLIRLGLFGVSRGSQTQNHTQHQLRTHGSSPKEFSEPQ